MTSCGCSLDLKDVKVVTKLGGTVDDSELLEGMVFDHKARPPLLSGAFRPFQNPTTLTQPYQTKQPLELYPKKAKFTYLILLKLLRVLGCQAGGQDGGRADARGERQDRPDPVLHLAAQDRPGEQRDHLRLRADGQVGAACSGTGCAGHRHTAKERTVPLFSQETAYDICPAPGMDGASTSDLAGELHVTSST